MNTSKLLKKGLTAEYKNGSWLIHQSITAIGLYDLEGSIQNACATLQGIKLPEGFERIKLSVQSKHYEDGYELVAIAERKATEAETLDLEQEKKGKEEEDKEWRRKQFENLKKEFGN